ncbi:rRNA maturation RNase YbeY [Desulfovulcanus sp.]
MIYLKTAARINPTLPISKRELLPILEKIMSFLGLSEKDIEVELVDDRTIEELNKNFLGCVGPTNVLSFPAEDEQNPEFLGQLVLSIDTLSREIFLYGQEGMDHLVRLLAHGILHLAGFEHGMLMDDMTQACIEEVRKIRRWEDRKLGS